MSMCDRAAQFSPFRAISGRVDAVEKTARLTERRGILDEGELAVLDRKLQKLLAHLEDKPEAEITYSVPDERKSGGACLTVAGVISRIDTQKRVLMMDNGRCIHLDDIVSIT